MNPLLHRRVELQQRWNLCHPHRRQRRPARDPGPREDPTRAKQPLPLLGLRQQPDDPRRLRRRRPRLRPPSGPVDPKPTLKVRTCVGVGAPTHDAWTNFRRGGWERRVAARFGHERHGGRGLAPNHHVTVGEHDAIHEAPEVLTGHAVLLVGQDRLEPLPKARRDVGLEGGSGAGAAVAVAASWRSTSSRSARSARSRSAPSSAMSPPASKASHQRRIL